MKRKNMFTSAVIITTTLSLSIGLSGCGKQGVEPVMAATVEQQTLTYEVTTEEESVTVTEEETESIEPTTTDEVETESVTIIEPTTTVTTDEDNLGVDGEFADGEYNELDEKETDKTVDETANTNETDNDVTAEIAADLGIKTVVIDGEVYIDLGGDDDDNSGYTPPAGDTTPLPPELGPNGSGNDDQGPDFPDVEVPKGHFIQ